MIPPLSTEPLSNSHASPPTQPSAAAKNTDITKTPAGRKLRQAAAEFESILLSSLWKSMKGSFASPDDSTDPAHDTLDGLAVQSLCAAIGKAGGLGLGRLILKDLGPKLENSHNGNISTPR
jgi:Rod binding domain-containing protein